MKHYYVKIDWSVSKLNKGYGFANAKKVVYFDTKQERDTYLKNRQAFDFSAEIVGRTVALKYLEELQSGDMGIYHGTKELISLRMKK